MAVLFCFYKYDRIMIPPGHLPCGSQKEVYPDDIEQGAQTQALSAYGGSFDDRDVCGAAACLFREGFGRGDGGLYRKTLRKRFDEEMTGLLLKYRWWDKSIEEINSLIPMLTSSDIEKVKSRIRELLG